RLQQWKMQVHEFSDAQSALEKTLQLASQKSPPDIILSDMQMPQCDGLQFAQNLKSYPSLQNIPFVLITSLGNPGESKRCKELNIRHHLTKPIRIKELLYTICDALYPNLSYLHNLSHSSIPTFYTSSTPVRVLIAEDNPVNQLVAKGFLEKLGARADTVANGYEALRALETIPYDILFLDVQMPELDGLETARRIRNANSRVLNKNIPIIAMTARAMRGDKEICLQAGMDDYIPKPVRIENFADMLKKWCSPLTKNSPSLPIS
ncbi:MAG: response regulator, partial [Chthoniobacterales bacterium]|nr:response regulator [Chthoniobacterales bacterium]